MFKVGDIITGIPGSDDEYGITNSRATLRVDSVSGEYITATLIAHKDPYDNTHTVGMHFDVVAKYFVLVNRPSSDGKTEIERKIAFMYRRFEER